MTAWETDLQLDKLYPDTAVSSLSRRRRRTGLVAVTLSVLIHACLVFVGLVLSTRSAAGPGLGLFRLDTRVHAGLELSVVLIEPASVPKAITIAPQSPAPVRHPIPQKVFQPAIATARQVVAAMPAPRSLPQEHGTPTASQSGGFSGQIPATIPLQPTLSPASGGETSVRGGRRPGKPSFFQIETDAPSVVYVIDRSASMGLNDGLLRARAELLASLEELPPATFFQIIPYNRRAETLCINGRTDLVPATAANRSAARLLVEAIQAEGGTDHVQALHRALALRADVVFFLTDADDLRPGEILTLTRFNAGKTMIHAFGLRTASNSAALSPLQMLAQGNRGCFQLIDPSR